ncbi:MAG: hypothetical protein AB7P37_03230 [Ramlibacter sp.]
MALTAPPAAPDAPPTAPSRSDAPATFVTRANAFVAWFGPFRTALAAFVTWYTDDAKPELEALQADVADKQTTASSAAGTATTQAGIATTQAGLAAASAASATNAANVQGTSTSSVAVATAVGQSKSFTYVESSRAIAVGMFVVVAVTASPDTNWMLLQVTAWDSGTKVVTGTVITYGGSGTYSAWTLSLCGPRGPAGADAVLTTPSLALTGTPTLVAGNNGYTGDVAAGAAIALDTLGTLGDGWSVMLVPASATNPGTVTADYGAGSEARPLAGPVLISVKNVSGTYTVRWLPLGRHVAQFGALGTPAVINTAASTGAALCALTATRNIGVYTSSAGRPRAALINSATGAIISVSADLESVSVSGATFDVKRLTDTTAVATWAISGAVKAVVLQNSSDTVGAGTVLTVESVSSTAQALAVFSATKVMLAYSDTGNTRNSARTLTVSGITLTANTRYSIHASTTAVQMSATALSATQALVTACNTGATTQAQALAITEASDVLTFPASWETIARCGSANTVAYSCVSNVSASRALVVAGVDPASTGRAVAMLVDVTGTGTGALLWSGRQTPITTPGGILSAHRLQRLSASSFMHQAAGDGTAATSTVTQLVIEGDAVRAGASKTLARKVSHQDIAWHSGAPGNAVALYVDGDNSNYPTTLQFSMGSVA